MSIALAQPSPTAGSTTVWQRYPTIYEINTWVWLNELSANYKLPLDLSTVPSTEWDAIASFGFDAVWLMGAWERSPSGVAISNTNANLQRDFQQALPDFHAEDNVGSPYCVRRYIVDQRLGGPHGLVAARRELSKRGMKLVLDFVPNHVAPDHPWVIEHPDFLVQGSTDEIKRRPESYFQTGDKILACGRDPFFPAWPDVLQLNCYNADLRSAIVQILLQIAEQCDGVRCDMAMLVLNTIFGRTWAEAVGMVPTGDFWVEIISAIKSVHPDFVFIAEAYWGLEWTLQQQGFDFCYDKTLYDRMEHGTAEDVRLHLCAGFDYQSKLLRFLENHDEPRAAATFSSAKERAVALATATLPGAKLFHEGQFEGRKVRLPVFLARRPVEHFDRELQSFYARLLEATSQRVFHEGQWSLSERTGWWDNDSYRNLLAWTWTLDNERYLIIVNFSDTPAQGLVRIPWQDAQHKTWHLIDPISNDLYERDGYEMVSKGLYVALEGWHHHFFQFVAG